MITFSDKEDLEKTMVFESLYEPNLQMNREEKEEILKNGLAVWLYIDGVLAGEAYGEKASSMSMQVPDVDECPDSFYLSSFSIIPELQNKGYGKLLFSYFLGKVSSFKVITTHATSPGMLRIGEVFGFQKLKEHDNWYNTDRKATFIKRQNN